MSEDACKVMSQLARRVTVWIAKQSSVGEESITDWLLFEASERLPYIRYQKFSKRVEGREVGADWEWWFVGKARSLALRVQAKRLRSDRDNYGTIAYANSYGMQIEKLIASAAGGNFVPVYCFYATAYQEETTACRWEEVADETQPYRASGVYISGAVDVFESFIASGKKRLFIPDFLSLSVPLSCIFCCPVARGYRPELSVMELYTFLGRRFRRTLENLRISSILEVGSDPASSASLPGIHHSIPGYVSDLLPPLEVEFRPHKPRKRTSETSPGASALVVVDMRQPRAVKFGPPRCGDPDGARSWDS